jgi:hypothetical protein
MNPVKPPIVVEQTFICRVCGEPCPRSAYEYNEIGDLEFWSCWHCGCDRVGIYYLERAGFDAMETHQKLWGRPGYKGVNMDTKDLVIKALREARAANVTPKI